MKLTTVLFLLHIFSVKCNELIQPDISNKLNLCYDKNLKFHNHTQFGYIHTEADICGNDPVDILLYVQSSLVNFERRKNIRSTFGSLRKVGSHNIKMFFVVGSCHGKSDKISNKLTEEINHYHDIVQADFIDTYRNLTLKHIVALHWIDNYCPQAKFISKSDDDAFVNIFNLDWYLFHTFLPSQKMILGGLSKNEKPIRQKGYKWTVDNNTYEEDSYPPFHKGFSYVMSQGAIKPLLTCSYYRKFFFIDDVFITGLVAKIAKVQLFQFNNYYRYGWMNIKDNIEKISDFLFLVGDNTFKIEHWKLIWNKILEIQLLS